MQDTISKNTGNSRTLASVPNFLTLYPTYEAFAQALINRELPIDLGPLNPAGLKQRGDDLNKENLLKDSTAALYGKPATAVPDDILAAIRPLITTAQNTANGKASIEQASYKGTNLSGESNKNSLTFSFPPKLLIIVGAKDNISTAAILSMSALGGNMVRAYQTGDTCYGGVLHASLSGNTVFWWSTRDHTTQMNENLLQYYALAIS